MVIRCYLDYHEHFKNYDDILSEKWAVNLPPTHRQIMNKLQSEP